MPSALPVCCCLQGCTLYVTLESCVMCNGAIVNGRLERVVYGCPDRKAGGAESLFNILSRPQLNYRVELRDAVC